MPIESMFVANEDGSWSDKESGEIYSSLPDLFSEVVSRWKSSKYALEKYDEDIREVQKAVDEMVAAEFGQLAVLFKEKAELTEIEKELQEVMRSLVVQMPEKQAGTTVSTRKGAEINERVAVQFLIAQGDAYPAEWLTLSKEGEKALKASVTDRDYKYFGYFPLEAVAYVEKKSAVIRADEILNGSKKKGAENG
jgi:hypothetical protein